MSTSVARQVAAVAVWQQRVFWHVLPVGQTFPNTTHEPRSVVPVGQVPVTTVFVRQHRVFWHELPVGQTLPTAKHDPVSVVPAGQVPVTVAGQQILFWQTKFALHKPLTQAPLLFAQVAVVVPLQQRFVLVQVYPAPQRPAMHPAVACVIPSGQVGMVVIATDAQQ